MTNQTDIAPGLELKPGYTVADIRIDDTPHWHAAIWELSVVLGFFVIILCFWRGWISHTKGLMTRKYSNSIAIASTLIIASSLINFCITIADWLDLINAGTMSYTTGCQMLLLIVSQEARNLGFSIGLATFGVILYILLPAGKRENLPKI